MTKAASSNTTQVADAIIALINSKPRSPTRHEIVAVLAGLTAINDNEEWKPTRLGHEMLASIPDYAEAAWYACCLGIDDSREPAIQAHSTILSHSLHTQMKSATDIVDLAIAYRIAADGETPADVEMSYRLRGEAPASPEEMGSAELCASYQLARAVLKRAGIAEDACSVGAYWRARGWMEVGSMYTRQPTQAEWDAFMDRIEPMLEDAA
jgi:hypothetical protein